MNACLRCASLALMLSPVASVAQDYSFGLYACVQGDYAAALEHWRPLAEQGDARAQVNLGNMHADGRGVPQDHSTAHMWLNIAAANDQDGSAKARDRVAQRMTPSDISEAQRRARACVTSGYRDCD